MFNKNGFSGDADFCIQVNEGEAALGDEVCFMKSNYSWDGLQLVFDNEELITGKIINSTISKKSKGQNYTIQLPQRKMVISSYHLFKGLYRKMWNVEADREHKLIAHVQVAA